jgi:hypothetical protein
MLPISRLISSKNQQFFTRNPKSEHSLNQPLNNLPMKTDQIPVALYRQFPTASPLLLKGLISIFLILLLAGNGFVVAQQTIILGGEMDVMMHDPVTISDGCEGYLSFGSGGTIMKSENFVIIKRGTYEYSLKLFVMPDGISATAYSEGGEIFNLNDELIFINSNSERAAFIFNSASEVNLEKKSMDATFPLDIERLKWLASAPITTVFIKNNIKNQC